MPKQKPYWFISRGVYSFAVLWDHLIRYKYVFLGVSTDLQWSVYHFAVFSLPFSSVLFSGIYTIEISLRFCSIQSTVLQYSVYHLAVFHLIQFSSIPVYNFQATLSELIQILVYFITLCPGWPCTCSYCTVFTLEQ